MLDPRLESLYCAHKILRAQAGLQSMAVSNEISGVQEQNIECASVQFDIQ